MSTGVLLRIPVDSTVNPSDFRLGLDWAQNDLAQFRRGIEVELEHGAHDPETDVTGDNLMLTGKIAWAHLKEIGDYYTRLDQLEAEAKSQA